MLKLSLSYSFRNPLVVVAVLCFCTTAWSQPNLEANRLPAFTLVRQVTDHDNAGHEYPGVTEKLYVSSRGDWRYEGTYPNGQIVETIYLCDKGVFVTDHRNKRLVKFGNLGSCKLQQSTSDSLEANPLFVRTESVLGQLAFLHRTKRHDSYVAETYYVPQLGPFPFMRVNYHKTYKRVEAPVSLTFGEPEESQLKVADYPLDYEEPVFDAKLSDRVEEKPPAKYSAEARAAGITGAVQLQVIVDEGGRVTRAAVITNVPLLSEAAVEAVYSARFSPGERDGKPVKVSGLISYQFPPQ